VFQFKGHDGSGFITSAQIQSQVDGVVSTGIVPGRLIFSTADATGTLTERMRIDKVSVSIGKNAAADASAQLELGDGTDNKGILLPRVALTSVTDAATIVSPATSLLVYNLGTGGLSPAGYYYNSGSSGSPNWAKISSTAAGGESCCSGWTLKAVLNSTVASLADPVSAAGVAVAGKEYLIVGFSNAGEFTLATTDNIFLAEGTAILPGAGYNIAGTESEVQYDYGFGTSVAGLFHENKKIRFCLPFLNGVSTVSVQFQIIAGFSVGLRGDGSFILIENSAALDYGLYIFER
jgi:hypothetical protein